MRSTTATATATERFARAGAALFVAIFVLLTSNDVLLVHGGEALAVEQGERVAEVEVFSPSPSPSPPSSSAAAEERAAAGAEEEDGVADVGIRSRAAAAGVGGARDATRRLLALSSPFALFSSSDGVKGDAEVVGERIGEGVGVVGEVGKGEGQGEGEREGEATSQLTSQSMPPP
jgi:hypothetical protein